MGKVVGAVESTREDDSKCLGKILRYYQALRNTSEEKCALGSHYDRKYSNSDMDAQ